MTKKGIYMLSEEDEFEWRKNEARKLRELLGSDKIGTRTVSRLLFDRVIIPNKIDLTKVIRPTIKLDSRQAKERENKMKQKKVMRL